jgi:hypothetical protein
MKHQCCWPSTTVSHVPLRCHPTDAAEQNESDAPLGGTLPVQKEKKSAPLKDLCRGRPHKPTHGIPYELINEIASHLGEDVNNYAQPTEASCRPSKGLLTTAKDMPA